ncbi:MAG: tail fiber assembly protein [Pseudomonas sp.]
MDIYHYDPVTGEFLAFGRADADPEVPDNWLIPAFATNEPPPAANTGYAVCRVAGQWVQVLDQRGTMAYRKTDGGEVTVADLGVLSGELTIVPRPSTDYVWAGTAWVVDESARTARILAEATARRALLLAQANEATSGMADAYIAGLMSDEEVAHYKAYAAYKLALSKLPQQSGWPASVVWPTLPA